MPTPPAAVGGLRADVGSGKLVFVESWTSLSRIYPALVGSTGSLSRESFPGIVSPMSSAICDIYDGCYRIGRKVLALRYP